MIVARAGEPFAAVQVLCLPLADGDVRRYGVELLRRGQRPDVHSFDHAAADFQRLHLRHELLGELVLDGLHHQDAARAGTSLTGQRKARP